MSFKTKSTGARTLMIVFLALVMVFALSAGISAQEYQITFQVPDKDGTGPDQGFTSVIDLQETDYIPAVAWEKEGYLFLAWQADETTNFNLTVDPITGYLCDALTPVTVSDLKSRITDWNHTLTAVYWQKTYSLKKTSDNTFKFTDETLKSIKGDPGDIAYNDARPITYTGDVPDGKKLIGWTVKEEDDTYVVLQKSFDYNVTG